VGDHPEVERILTTGVELGFRCSVSSIRIPAVTEGVLAALHASGDRSITLAPETGNDALRIKMGKHVSNAMLLDKVRLIAAAGFTQLKLYFLVGLPDETLDDVRSILDLAAEVRAIFKAQAPKTGVMGHVHLGVNVLVPKPYTPWQRHPMPPSASSPSASRCCARARRGCPTSRWAAVHPPGGVADLHLEGGPEAADLLERAARGQHIASLLREFADRIAPEVFVPLEGDLRWHFLRTG
jgi:radical SAM superfamily enzyme YgiQ (UPF0313 family)